MSNGKLNWIANFAAFGSWKVTVERPLHLHSQLTLKAIEKEAEGLLDGLLMGGTRA